MRLAKVLIAIPALLVATACTVIRVDSKDRPPRIVSSGLIDAHVAVGIPSESHLFHFDLFDGTSPGAIGEIVIWKLFRLEIGLAGISMSLGPLHCGLGVLAYEPEVPSIGGKRQKRSELAARKKLEDREASAPSEETVETP